MFFYNYNYSIKKMNTIRNLSCSSGGEAVLRNLLLNDCTVCFTNPGTSEMHFFVLL